MARQIIFRRPATVNGVSYTRGQVATLPDEDARFAIVNGDAQLGDGPATAEPDGARFVKVSDLGDPASPAGAHLSATYAQKPPGGQVDLSALEVAGYWAWPKAGLGAPSSTAFQTTPHADVAETVALSSVDDDGWFFPPHTYDYQGSQFPVYRVPGLSGLTAASIAAARPSFLLEIKDGNAADQSGMWAEVDSVWLLPSGEHVMVYQTEAGYNGGGPDDFWYDVTQASVDAVPDDAVFVGLLTFRVADVSGVAKQRISGWVAGGFTIGAGTVASSFASSAVGGYSHAEGDYSHVQGHFSHAQGDYSHAEGYYSHAEGYSSHAQGSFSHAEGSYAHAQGYYAHAQGDYSHAEGYYAHAQGDYSHAQGHSSHAQGHYSHAEGYYAHAREKGAHARGGHTWDSGVGQSQYVARQMYANTTTASPAVLTGAGGASGEMVLAPARAAALTGLVAARSQDGALHAAWQIKALVKVDAAGASTLVNPTVTSLGADAGAASWTVALAGRGSLSRVGVIVTGAAGVTIHWSANIETQEVM